MALLNKLGYDPTDDDSASGYRRPPRDPRCINDYFYTLGGIEDEGAFAAAEMAAMLANQDAFFGDGAKRAELLSRVGEALSECSSPRSDGRGLKNYLRFVPLETPSLRWGLSLNIRYPPESAAAVKAQVAEYLTDSILSLTRRGA